MRKTRLFLMAVQDMLREMFGSCEKNDNGTNGDNNVADNDNENNKGNNSTGDWVDLGLPSGLLWATRNVGANNPEEYGLYFAWGETQPKSVYDWTRYKYCNGDYDQLTKYCDSLSYGYSGFTDNLTTLQNGDDAVTANRGSGWRTPTVEDWQELLDSCTDAWVTQNGVNGYRFTGRNGNVLFLPAAGNRWGGELSDAGIDGLYWSSSLYPGHPDYAWYILFDSDDRDMGGRRRYLGLSVRPVRSPR